MSARLDACAVRRCADDLRSAGIARQAIAPIRLAHPAIDADSAYAIQEYNTRTWLAAGRRLVGRKIGLTSPAVQAQFGIGQPDFGMLFADMAVAAGGQIAMAGLIQPRIEGEIAFVMRDAVTDTACSAEALVAAIDYAVPALEIVDSRIADWDIGFADTVADNASSALFVVGEGRVPITGFDPAACTMALYAGDLVVASGQGSACMGSPLNAALWLARKMAAVGRPLAAGDIILSGALGPMLPLVAATRYRLEIDGVGTVEVTT